MLATGCLSDGLYNNESSLFLLLLQINYFFSLTLVLIHLVCVCEFVMYICIFCVGYLLCHILKTWWQTYDPDNDGQLNMSRRLSRRLNKAMSHEPSYGQRQDWPVAYWPWGVPSSRHFLDQPIPNGISISSAIFAYLTAESSLLYFTMGCPSPSKQQRVW